MADSQHLNSVGLDSNASQINNWRSIVTLIVFVATNIIVISNFHIPVYVPLPLYNGIWATLSTLRLIPPRRRHDVDAIAAGTNNGRGWRRQFVQLGFPMNMVTAPLIADLFLLAIRAIGREEVHDGTVGANNISPFDIMAFFLTLAYIAISIDASGLVRFLAFRVLQKGGKVGHNLFFYLYAFFFSLGSFIGNDPIILSGTAFLAYMTRVSSNIVHPRAWIYSQFAVANIASAILVSSNPTNLVLAGAFKIKFIDYTANMIVPTVITAIVLFPFLLYFIFADETLIPLEIKMHELSDAQKAKPAVNPNIPQARGELEEQEDGPGASDQAKSLPLEEIMNPFLDKGGAAFGAVVMAATLITVLALNAASQNGHEGPIYWVTLPAAFVMFLWDVGFGWLHRHETREIARKGREEIQIAREERAAREKEAQRAGLESPCQEGALELSRPPTTQSPTCNRQESLPTPMVFISEPGGGLPPPESARGFDKAVPQITPEDVSLLNEISSNNATETRDRADKVVPVDSNESPSGSANEIFDGEIDEKRPERDVELQRRPSCNTALEQQPQQETLASLTAKAYSWSQETFPTATVVVTHLPFALVPFALSMFVLVQALVTKGWVQVFAHGWDQWVAKTGTVGSIGGMGFLSVILCNFAGTNIGTTILLCRVIQAWEEIRSHNISDRTFWGTVYSMAIGVNYGAFSTAFSASLAGLLWRDILFRKHIRVPSLEFARVNLPIIIIAMTIGHVGYIITSVPSAAVTALAMRLI
ncbi:hypothetical protein DL766_003686 [Monosporascus sp. MC13-8B]|uniref:Citrate transporter-like domain-containing protein n=1 Tax=Monosporascus cannonballus TaxID=155416 RepID=A0ABY0HF61_9PEZI|nr:hypothetical protein DL762_001869 [Monosporascus cannonballus]RYO98285.1 hypothetical protein DL763_002296 [Monosporascus cannonballus]RYP33054.1 hypothetical protein DL766_003686 [Monosporascus sp. MC13-8B]